MKRMSQFLAIITSFIILISAFVMPVSAAETVKYSIASATGEKGDTVTVTVNVSSNVGVTAAIIDINYDSSKLEYVDGINGNVFMTCSVRHQEGTSNVRCTGITMGDSSAKKSGIFATLKFKIIASSGSASLKIIPSSDAGDHCGVGTPPIQLTPSVSNGKITITVPDVSVTGISLDKTSVSLKKGESTTLKATVKPDNATNKTVTYTSSNTKVATVNSSGKVTAVGGGKATITAKAGSKTATCTVTVTVPQTGISASGSTTRKVTVGDTVKLSVVKVPSDSTDNFNVKWTSSNTKIATVSNGTVKAVAPGTVNITAESNGWKVVYKFTVEKKSEESTTQESTTAESTTIESTTEESSTELDSTESTTLVESETQTTEDYSLVEPTTNNNQLNNDFKKSLKYLIVVAVVGVAVGFIVLVSVILIVVKNRIDAKKKSKENKITIEEKHR